ncbi:MAG: hypothetical protein KAI83_01690, partial [Thiomargarita sp.]|nr:hypothetical protein [Thiomargarita sp.]
LEKIGFLKPRAQKTNYSLVPKRSLGMPSPTLRVNAIKLSQGEHAGLPLQISTYSVLVGANLRVRPGLT